MVKPVSRENSAAQAPAAEQQVKTNGRLIQRFEHTPNYRFTKAVLTTELRSKNMNIVVRGAERTAYAVAALVVGIFQTIDNVLREIIAKGLANAVLIPYIAIRDRNKGKEQTVEVEMAPVAPATTAEEAHTLEEQPVATPKDAPAPTKVEERTVFQTLKNNKGKVLAVAALAAAATILHFNPPLVAMISSKLASAASSLGFGGGYAGYAGNYAGYAGNYAGYAGYAGSVA